jgi:hypothetical protein
MFYELSIRDMDIFLFIGKFKERIQMCNARICVSLKCLENPTHNSKISNIACLSQMP